MLRRTTGTALSEAGVPVATAAAMLGHSVQVNRAYVLAHRDAEERDRARDALVELGFGVVTDEPNAAKAAAEEVTR